MATAKNKKFSVAIIGCGSMGFFMDHKRKGAGALSHFKAFRDNKNFEIVALADPQAGRRAVVAKVSSLPVFANHKELLAKFRPDVVVVATSSETHEAILKDVLAAKPKLVFAEKPLTLDPDSSEEIIALYEKAQIGLQVNYSRRFIDIFQDIKKMLEQNKLGKIQAVNFFYSRGFLNNGSHFLDLISWYWGQPQDVIVESERAGLHENDSTLSVRLKYPGQMEIRLIGLETSSTAIFEMDIWGAKGRVRVVNNELCEFYQTVKSKDFKGFDVYELKNTWSFNRLMALPRATQNIANWLNKKEKLISPAADSRLALAIFKELKGMSVCQN